MSRWRITTRRPWPPSPRASSARQGEAEGGPPIRPSLASSLPCSSSSYRSEQPPRPSPSTKICGTVLRPEARGTLAPEDLIEWARGRMAAYKVPRLVEFFDSLPRTVSGKVLWREMQDRQNALDRR